MSAQQLQQLMIINKTAQLKWSIRLKSIILSVLTWMVWSGTFAILFIYQDHIMQRPVIDMYYIGDIISMMLTTVIGLILCAIIWSLVNKTQLKQPV